MITTFPGFKRVVSTVVAQASGGNNALTIGAFLTCAGACSSSRRHGCRIGYTRIRAGCAYLQPTAASATTIVVDAAGAVSSSHATKNAEQPRAIERVGHDDHGASRARATTVIDTATHAIGAIGNNIAGNTDRGCADHNRTTTIAPGAKVHVIT